MCTHHDIALVTKSRSTPVVPEVHDFGHTHKYLWHKELLVVGSASYFVMFVLVQCVGLLWGSKNEVACILLIVQVNRE